MKLKLKFNGQLKLKIRWEEIKQNKILREKEIENKKKRTREKRMEKKRSNIHLISIPKWKTGEMGKNWDFFRLQERDQSSVQKY